MLMIRLTSVGKKGERKYRIIVREKRSRLAGKPVETLGWYQKSENGEQKELNIERYKYWVSVGAIPSPQVKALAQS